VLSTLNQNLAATVQENDVEVDEFPFDPDEFWEAKFLGTVQML